MIRASDREEKTMTETTNGGPRVLDLTRYEFTSSWARDETPTQTTEKEEKTANEEQPYQRFLVQQNVKADMNEEDAAFEAFAAESGLNDLTGRVPGTREVGDFSAPTEEGVETSATAAMSDEAAWRSFVDVTGFEETATAPQTGGASDLSEDDEGSSLSDEEAWRQFAEAVGMGR